METSSGNERLSQSPDEVLFEEWMSFLLVHGEMQPEPAVPGSYYFVIDRNKIPTTSPDVPREMTFTPAHTDQGEMTGDYLSMHFLTDADGIEKIVTFYRLDGVLSVEVDHDVPFETDDQYMYRLNTMMDRAHWGLREKREWLETFLSEDHSAGIEEIELARLALIATRQHFS